MLERHALSLTHTGSPENFDIYRQQTEVTRPWVERAKPNPACVALSDQISNTNTSSHCLHITVVMISALTSRLTILGY